MKPGIETFPRQGAGEVWSQALLEVRPESYLTVQLGIMGCLGTECQALCPVMGLQCEVPPGTTTGASGDGGKWQGASYSEKCVGGEGRPAFVSVSHTRARQARAVTSCHQPTVSAC